MDTTNQNEASRYTSDKLLLKYEQLGDKSKSLAILAILFLAAKGIKQSPQEGPILRRYTLQKLRNICLAEIANFGEEVQGIVLQYLHQSEEEPDIP